MISKKHFLALAALFTLNVHANTDNIFARSTTISSDDCHEEFGFYTNFHIDTGILPVEITITNNSDKVYLSPAQNSVQHPGIFNFNGLIARIKKQRVKDIFFNIRYDIIRRYSNKDIPDRDNDTSIRAIKRQAREAFLTHYKNHIIEPGATYTYVIFLDKGTVNQRAEQPILITLESEQNPADKVVLQVGVPRGDIDLF